MSIMAITDESGVLRESRSYDAWGRPRDPSTWAYQLTPFGAVNFTSHGYTFHEHLIQYSLINMNARMYDPVLGRVLSPDNFVQDATSTQNFNRYTYCLNNPLKYTDPDGNVIFTAAVLISAAFTGGATLGLLPTAIGADLGMWQGGSVANGTANPFKWDYSSGKTWGYMAGGAAIGAFSGAIGVTMATAGGAGAATMAIAMGSFTNSTLMSAMTNGQTDVSISFGAASYNMTDNEWGHLGKEGNSAMENVGYGLGALANVGDILAGANPGTLELRTENDVNNPTFSDGKKDLIGHSQLVDKSGNPIIDWGPVDRYWNATNSYEKGVPIGLNKMKWGPIEVEGVNLKRINSYSSHLNKGGKYNLFYNNCVSQTSRALNMSGVLNLGVHPYLLHAQMYLRSIGVRPTQYSYYLTE